MNNSSGGATSADSSSEHVDGHEGRCSTEAIDDLKRRAAEYVEHGKQTAAGLTATIERQIRQRPVEAVAVAAGIGFVLGLFWNRRS
ncbi:MAG TPA: DUF883 C-terminal domain-containing protein [Pirellulales bacterium]|nr:DUF883 C-terminal domain-containing protein [Pirellulales bacterium]